MDDVTDEKLAEAVREAAQALNDAMSKARANGLRCEVGTLEFEIVGRGAFSEVRVSVARPL